MALALHPPPYDTRLATMVAESTVEYVRAGGPGGQHRNKRETGIRLVHLPSGLIIMATERRSRAQNESLAFERLRERLADLNYVPEARIPTRTPRRAKAARMDDKRRVGEKKKGRSRPRLGGDDG